MRVLFLIGDSNEIIIMKDEHYLPCFPIDNTFTKFDTKQKLSKFKGYFEKCFYITIQPEIRDFSTGDPVYYISGDILYYGIIKHESKYFVKFKDGIWTEKTKLVPYKWWELKTKCRLAILEFCKCSKRMLICRDVRNIISKLIWDSRNDYIWL
jgi:hypothetical protein